MLAASCDPADVFPAHGEPDWGDSPLAALAELYRMREANMQGSAAAPAVH